MDPLSDVLRTVRLTGAYFYLVEAVPPWSTSALPAREFSPRILPDAEHLIPYHILTEGSCWAGLEGEAQRRMQPGDIIVFPQGGAHFLSSQQGERVDGPARGASPDRYPTTVTLGKGRPEAKLVCGFLGCDARPFNPLLAALPPVLRFPRSEDGWLTTSFSEHAVRESNIRRAGGDTMLTRMAELMFIEVLRRHLETLSGERTGWLAGLKDPLVGAVLARIHEQPAHNWSLASLAREVSASRSVLAERFTHLVGLPVMQYVAQWRLQLAAELLLRGNANVANVGRQVGYDSEAAFSRAFKRAMGESPAHWRKARPQG
jgi:AraC-like DNA-binding protein